MNGAEQGTKFKESIHDFYCVLGPCHTVQFFLQLAMKFYTLGRSKIGKYKFPSQFSNIFLTYQHLSQIYIS